MRTCSENKVPHEEASCPVCRTGMALGVLVEHFTLEDFQPKDHEDLETIICILLDLQRVVAGDEQRASIVESFLDLLTRLDPEVISRVLRKRFN